jgi:7,8-dihydropterin-6-yl-methyl-4-(beta-D-ribofuranosyl)aminobenzene 5'-phosphate synthase
VTYGIKITILVDNRAEDDLRAEHGLSLWIEADWKRVLFDTGQSEALLENARSLDLDLAKADAIVLSHGHYDHTGGLARVLEQAAGAHLYFHPSALQTRYSITAGEVREIQLPSSSLAAIESLPSKRSHLVVKPLMLAPRIGLTGPIPRESSCEDTGGPFYLDREGLLPDPIEDDLAIWIAGDQGALVCVGCSHAGIINTLNYVRHVSASAQVRAVLGGFHLLNADRRRIDETLQAFRALDPGLIVCCHCTGGHATETLRGALGERVLVGSAGLSYQF